VRGDLVHGIVSRRTLYGVHRPVMRADMDLCCSKTALLFFTDRKAALQFGNCHLYTSQNPRAPRRPWRLESMPFPDLEQICLLNYLDMYLCFHMMSDGGGGSGGEGSGSEGSSGEGSGGEGSGTASAVLNCYEYKTTEYPNRPILNKIMEDLWRKN